MLFDTFSLHFGTKIFTVLKFEVGILQKKKKKKKEFPLRIITTYSQTIYDITKTRWKKSLIAINARY